MIPVILVMAVTADGMISKNQSQLIDWTSREDKQHFVALTKEHGVVMMGRNTFATLPAPLKGRLNVVFTREEGLPEIEGVKWVNGDPKKVLAELASLGYRSAVLGGGASLNSLFLKEGLISEINLTIAPKIFGAGLNLFDQPIEADLKLLEFKKLNDDILMIRYRVDY